jgi:hypothetical protein
MFNQQWTKRPQCIHPNMKMTFRTYRLNIIMSIDKDGLFAGICPDLTENCWRQWQLLAFNSVKSKIDELGLDTSVLEMIVEKICHSDDILTASSIPTYAVKKWLESGC